MHLRLSHAHLYIIAMRWDGGFIRLHIGSVAVQ